MTDSETTPADAPVNGLLRPGIAVAAGLAVGQVLGYALAVLGARVLGPATFGELSALLSLLVIGAVVPLAVQTVTARRVAARDAGSSDLALMRLGLVTGSGVTLVGLLLAPVAAAVLRLDVLPVALVAVTLLPLTLAAVVLGRAQGQEEFARLGAYYAVLALGRVGSAVVVLLLTRSLVATMLATSVGAAVSWALVQARSGLPWRWARSATPGPLDEVAHVGQALLAMFVLTNADLLLARAALSPEDAGAYAAGAIVIKVAFWLPQAVAVVVFPRLAEGRPGTLTRGVAVVVALGGAVTLGVAALGPWLLPALLGPSYASVVGTAWLYGVAGTAQAVAYLVLFSRLADQDRRAGVAVWVAVGALVTVVLTVGHSSPTSIVVAVIAVTFALAAVGLAVPRRQPGTTASGLGHAPGTNSGA